MPTDKTLLIRHGRALVRLIEAIDVLLAEERRRAARATWRDARDQAVRQLRELVRDQPPSVTAEILAASDKIAGLERGGRLN